MRLLIAILAYALVSWPALAITIKDFDAKPTSEQSAFVAGFIEKMTSDLGSKNPQMAQSIRDWFARKTDARPASEGLERLVVELAALESLARAGKVELSSIQVEGVIVKVVKDKFPPQQVPPASSTATALRPFDARAVIEQSAYLLALTQRQLANPTVKEFETWGPAEQVACLTKLVRDTRDHFVRTYPGDATGFNGLFERTFAVNQAQVSSQGVQRIHARLAEVNNLAQRGNADLSKMRMRDIVEDAVLNAISAEESRLRQRMKEIENNAIKLNDGRHAYVDGNNFRDDNGALLQGADLQEARQKYRQRQ